MATIDRLAPPRPSPSLVGTWRRFGRVGPVYEVLGIDRQLDDGDWMMRIRVVESGEELDYKLSSVLDDPRDA